MFMTPLQGITDIQVFLPKMVISTARFQAYYKPPGCSFLEMIVVAGGGGGGGGASGIAGTGRGGGGGGGSGAISRLLIPALFVPDVVWVQVGRSVLGGEADLPGGAAADSYVSLVPDATAVWHRFGEAQGGSSATAGTATAGGTAGSGVAATSRSFAALGIIVSANGQAGGTGGFQNGNNITHPTTLFVSGGAGGAGIGTNNVAGSAGLQVFTNPVTGPRLMQLHAAGQDGFNRGLPLTPALLLGNRPLLFSGGNGGIGNPAGTGGNGGHGALGCGGGGGGGGLTGGRGGDGGSGFVVIGAW